jgi:hypothetical protein
MPSTGSRERTEDEGRRRCWPGSRRWPGTGRGERQTNDALIMRLLLQSRLQLRVETLASHPRPRAGADSSCVTASTNGPWLDKGPVRTVQVSVAVILSAKTPDTETIPTKTNHPPLCSVDSFPLRNPCRPPIFPGPLSRPRSVPQSGPHAWVPPDLDIGMWEMDATDLVCLVIGAPRLINPIFI